MDTKDQAEDSEELAHSRPPGRPARSTKTDYIVVILPSGGVVPKQKRSPWTPNELKAFVGGTIEQVSLANVKQRLQAVVVHMTITRPATDMLMNRDGQAKGLPVNAKATKLLELAGIQGRQVFGTVVLRGIK